MARLNDTAVKSDATRIDENNSSKRSLCLRLEDFFVNHNVFAQYYVAAMLLIINTIYLWKCHNVTKNWIHAQYNLHFFYPEVKRWSLVDIQPLHYGSFGMIPGALLIYITSSHKFLTVAVVVSFILHMVTPLLVDSGILVYIIVAQTFVEAPIPIAVLSMWKDWAPPGQRTKFVFLSFSSWILVFPFSYFLDYFSNLYKTKESFYISGACGLVWSLIWYITVPDTPKYPQSGQLCLQNDTLSTAKRPTISEVPWKSIITSMPVFALCLISFKIGSSFAILDIMTYVFTYRLEKRNDVERAFSHLLFAIFYALVLASSVFITDFLSRKFPTMVKIRKRILCGALIIHAFLLLGTLIPNLKFQVICYCLSYFIFSTSLAGFITNALDLSSQFVPIIGGFRETFYLLGLFWGYYYMFDIYNYFKKLEEENPFGKLLFYEIGFTVLVAVIFQIWGSVEEQPWSLKRASSHRSSNVHEHSVQVLELRTISQNV